MFRRVVTTVAEGRQRETERGPSGMLPVITLTEPVSIQTLSSISVPPPTRLRVIDAGPTGKTLVRFRTVPFHPVSAQAATTTLDTRRGFDIGLVTASDAPAALEYRYVIGRGDDHDDFALQRFAWSAGDAVAAHETIRVRGVAQPDGSQLIRLGAGYGGVVTLRITTNGSGLLQIVDAY